jgi:tetratricopeptide (TPR) repeat protein
VIRLFAALILVVLSLPARAETPEQLYARCMELARADAEAALALARTWAGPSARHCEAVALMGLQRYSEAAARFRHLAMEGEARLKPDMLAQAGQAFMLDNQPEEAEAVLGEALALRPDDAALLIDRGVALAEQFRYAAAVQDFDAALARTPNNADALLFRAAALRKLDRLKRAMKDVEAALVIRPRSPDGLLERGILKRLTGDRYGARADWQAILTDWPDSVAAEAASVNIYLLDNPPELAPPEQPGDGAQEDPAR